MSKDGSIYDRAKIKDIGQYNFPTGADRDRQNSVFLGREKRVVFSFAQTVCHFDGLSVPFVKSIIKHVWVLDQAFL